jgi:hypothetical protein
VILDFGGLLPAEFTSKFAPGALNLGIAPEVKFPLEDGDVLFDAPREHMEKMKAQLPLR